MMVYIKTLTSERIAIDVEHDELIEEVKAKIKKKKVYPPDDQILIYAGE